ncbi:phosphate ABC transporter permease [Bacillus pseudomycoides]|uniref:Phosphate ABC transporter permease n=1 Tax=Bacillus pseudomycoides TaxID=64104 RepID=A0AA91ZU04_9BACI|nr:MULTISPECIES: phosphate ABC transporter permease [Bacillus]PEB53629.1 phosphate ABC transporter permease [Bacillus sp. AFS098217]PED83290.1 phosphate ABC transporter permease [Bacillus pseudomycoides]PEU10142.1 phosphate ABC transporter permease [Bacillus sp. AFS019443]PEU19981.1 phosphate ABC transporter permease [Bacillus sp. AFS014408]PFW62150.1 phosphate ABC transporter permease [Bacillus sp. AFS075034]
MIVFGYPLETIYLYGFIVATILTVLYIFFGDIFESIFSFGGGSTSIVTLLLSFFAMLCGFSYIGEYLFSLNSIVIFSLAFCVSFLGVFAMKILILKPIAEAEQNTVQRMDEFVGCRGEVIITIPKEGFGEVLISSQFGSNAIPAKTIGKKEILQGTEVIIEEVQDGVLLVQNIAYSLKKPKL